jgi:hypothetical protein
VETGQVHELREKWFHNKVFASLDALEDQLVGALSQFEQQPEMMKSIAVGIGLLNVFLMRIRISAFLAVGRSSSEDGAPQHSNSL